GDRGKRARWHYRGISSSRDFDASFDQAPRPIGVRQQAGFGDIFGAAIIDKTRIGNDPYAKRGNQLGILRRNYAAMFDPRYSRRARHFTGLAPSAFDRS